MIVTALIYRSLWNIAAGYLTAAIAPEPEMRYVMILAAIGLIAGTIGAIVTIPMGITQTWYPIFLAVTGPVFVWIGGKLRVKKAANGTVPD
jgi:hypothetical protein